MDQSMKIDSYSSVDLAVAKRGLGMLTDREREVMALVDVGRTAKEIAKIIGCRHRTVETHRMRVLQKLGVHKATEIPALLAVLALMEA